MGGYGLYLLKGKPVFSYNLLMLLTARWAGDDTIPPGKHVIVFDFTYDGPGVAKSGTGILSVDGKEVHTLKIPRTVPFTFAADETFDVGMDTRTGVNDLDYQVPFPFNGTINKLTFKLGPTQLAEGDHKKIQLALAVAND